MTLSLADASPDEIFGSEDRQIALAFVTEAFAEAVLAGVEGECFAHAAIFAALQELVATYGEEPSRRLCRTPAGAPAQRRSRPRAGAE